MTAETVSSPGFSPRLWHRDLTRYPSNGVRFYYLGVVVVTTIILYYQLYITGSVATSILNDFHMSFGYYVGILVIANAIGAFTSLATGMADRFGRANLVVYGTIVTSLICFVGIPNVNDKFAYGAMQVGLAFVEGIILVATPALVRDFSPQVGRASAMAFWTMGPVVGSLVATEVSSHTLSHLDAWQDQFIIAGIAGLVVALIGLLSLRELSAGLRDQVMVSLEERTVLEMRARGLDVEEATRKPYRQMFKGDILAPALAISLFLVLYYTAVAFFPIFLQTVFNFTQSESNSLLNWYWATNAVTLVMIGALSDRLAIRKPFMLAGALGTILVTATLISFTTHKNPQFTSVAIILALIGLWQGTAFVAWMASFTETVERRNPALVATGLAVWGWILRGVVAVAFVLLPQVVSSVTPLVNEGGNVQAIVARNPQLVAEVQAHPDVFQQLASFKDPASIPPAVIQHAIETVGIPTLAALQNPQAQKDLAYLQKHAANVQEAQKNSPHEWQHWFWLCLGGQILFIPLMFTMAGYWNPRRAKEQRERRDAEILSGGGVGGDGDDATAVDLTTTSDQEAAVPKPRRRAVDLTKHETPSKRGQ
ncbi:MAG: MFS transporter [Actinomycetes bacterium]